jgi:hypothetical protein
MLTEKEAVALIRAGALKLRPFEIQVSRTEWRADGRVDFNVELRWRKSRRQFLAEYVSVPTPRRLRDAVEQARKYASLRGALPLLIAPYLNADALDLLTREEVSGIDLSGNGAVIAEDWLVLRSGAKNRHPMSTPIKAIYRGTSSLVGRVFLSRPEYERFPQIRAEIERRGGRISPSTVSKVLQGLEEDLVIERGENLRLVQPARLLDRLARSYGRTRAVRRIQGKALVDDATLFLLLRAKADASGAWLAGRDEQRYVLAPSGQDLFTIYTSSIDTLVSANWFREDDRFPELEIIETHRQEVFFDAREDSGFRWCSPLQIYLELVNGGKRQREVAEQLRPDLLDFRYA